MPGGFGAARTEVSYGTRVATALGTSVGVRKQTFPKRLFSKIEPDPPIRIRSRLIGIRLGGSGSLIGSPSRSPSAIPYWIAVGEREGAPELRHFTHP